MFGQVYIDERVKQISDVFSSETSNMCVLSQFCLSDSKFYVHFDLLQREKQFRVSFIVFRFMKESRSACVFIMWIASQRIKHKKGVYLKLKDWLHFSSRRNKTTCLIKHFQRGGERVVGVCPRTDPPHPTPPHLTCSLKSAESYSWCVWKGFGIGGVLLVIDLGSCRNEIFIRKLSETILSSRLIISGKME